MTVQQASDASAMYKSGSPTVGVSGRCLFERHVHVRGLEEKMGEVPHAGASGSTASERLAPVGGRARKIVLAVADHSVPKAAGSAEAYQVAYGDGGCPSIP